MSNSKNAGISYSLRKDALKFLERNAVVLLFLFLSIAGFLVSGQPASFFLQEIVSRFTRNAFLVLSLIIPVIAGIGLNFAIVIGAMAGQMGLIHAMSFSASGFSGLLLAVGISTPLAILFGFLTGKILNKTKGNEMIASMVLGYLANGIYQFIYLVMAGPIIPIPNSSMLLESDVGLMATCSLSGTLKGTLDKLWKTSLRRFAIYGCIFLILFAVFCIIRDTRRAKKEDKRVLYTVWLRSLVLILSALVVLYLAFFNANAIFTLNFVDISISTLIAIGLLCLFNRFIFKTKLGQDFRSVGHNLQVAAVAGINVDRTRTIAIIFSTVFAAWGQIIHLQNIGTFNTYSSHEQVGLLAVASILVGGASVIKANNKQALVGVLLFHAMFSISPIAGTALFDQAQVGEFFRVFIAYGVIFVALALNAINSRKERKNALAALNEQNRCQHP